MARPRKTTGGPLAEMTHAEVAAVATATGRALSTVETWRRGNRRAPAIESDRVAETLHAGDPVRWPDPVALARRIREDGPRR